jgi:hypothetical protein
LKNTIRIITLFILFLGMMPIFSVNAFASEISYETTIAHFSNFSDKIVLSNHSNQNSEQTQTPHPLAIVKDAEVQKEMDFYVFATILLKLKYGNIQVESSFIHLHALEKQSLYFPVNTFLPEIYIQYQQLKSDLI